MTRWKSFTLFPLIFCLTFLVVGLVVNVVQLFLFFTLPANLFKRLNYYLMYCIYGYLLFLGDWWSQSNLRVFAEEELAKQLETETKGAEHGLILMNHHTELDWIYSWMGADRLGVLGNCRVFAKDSLKYAPILGWAWALSDTIFLKRNWEDDRVRMGDALQRLFNQPRPVWLLLFPEGTRISPAKQAASTDYCRAAGLPVLKHHLLPRTKGFSFVAEHVDRSRVRAVFDITLVEKEGSAPFTLASILAGESTCGALLVRRLPMDSLPKEQEASSAWLINLFQEKDQAKENFVTTRNFGPQYREVNHTRGKASLIIFLVSNSLVVAGLLILLLRGDLVVRGMLVAFLGIVWLVLAKLITITKIANASNQGLKNNKSSELRREKRS